MKEFVLIYPNGQAIIKADEIILHKDHPALVAFYKEGVLVAVVMTDKLLSVCEKSCTT